MSVSSFQLLAVLGFWGIWVFWGEGVGGGVVVLGFFYNLGSTQLLQNQHIVSDLLTVLLYVFLLLWTAPFLVHIRGEPSASRHCPVLEKQMPPHPPEESVSCRL